MFHIVLYYPKAVKISQFRVQYGLILILNKLYKGRKKTSYVCHHCSFCENIDIVHAIAGVMALLCKQLGARKIAIDPIMKDDNLIENFSLYCGEYRGPSTEDI